jgi:hypothetical protein
MRGLGCEGTKMQISTKETIAIVICLGSALVAVVSTRAGFRLPNVLSGLGIVWFCAGWVSPLPWSGRNSFAELFAMAQRGKLNDSRIASIISLGGMTIMVLSFVAVYQSTHFLK